MRWGLIAWCLIGVGLIGLKAYLDLSHEKHGDIAVRAGDVVYRVPRDLVTNEDGWRADFSRLNGCWDIREAGVGGWIGSQPNCSGANSLHLNLAKLGGDGAMLGRYATSSVFWRAYAPPSEHARDVQTNWHSRVLSYREDWQLHRLSAPGSSWIYLFSKVPTSVQDVARTYAGRCFRSDFGSDIGMSCTVVVRLDGNAALEYSIGPDAVPEFAALQTQARRLVARWKCVISLCV